MKNNQKKEENRFLTLWIFPQGGELVLFNICYYLINGK